MAWIPRTTAPSLSDPDYHWDWGTAKQCTWYAYLRVIEGGESAPEWQDGYGANGSGKYTHAKYWLQHYRDPWIPHNYGDGYIPKAGDIIVFTGTHGHCVVVEYKQTDGKYHITDFNLIGGTEEWGRKTDYTYGNTISGPDANTGACIGCLEYPYEATPDDPPDPGPTPEDPITISIVANIILKKGGNFNVKL